MRSNATPVYSDRLVAEFRLPDGRRARQGLRLATRLQGILTREEIRAYVEHGTVRAIRIIKENRNCALAEAKLLLDQVRGGPYSHGRGL